MEATVFTNQNEKLRSALRSAFPTRAALDQLLYFRLEVALNQIDASSDVDEAAAKVIEWANSAGRLPELFAAARAEDPANRELREAASLVPSVAVPEASVRLRLRDVLLQAFPRYEDLEKFVRINLERSLSEISGREALRDVVMDLIRWCDAEGRLPELVRVAARERPDRGDLQALVDLWPRSRGGAAVKGPLESGSAPAEPNAAATAGDAPAGDAPAGEEPPDAVPTHVDVAAHVDRLHRVGLARVLAARLRRLRAGERQPGAAAGKDRAADPLAGSFMLHLHGPWGFGKSSLLNLLKDQLDRDPADPWIVVEFNAWQHQRLGFPWWWMLCAVYRQGVPASGAAGFRNWGIFAFIPAVGIRARHAAWLFGRSGVFPYVVALALILWGINLLALPAVSAWLSSLFEGKPSTEGPLASAGRSADAVIKIITLATTLIGLLLGAGRLFQRPAAAREFMEASRDPMRDLTEHFNWLVSSLRAPVAVFIDDLDRCNSSYLTELLEGIQTCLREVPIVYVVAADRRWLCASYEKAYETFKEAVREPGQPLGYLFLDKLFQLSVAIPRLAPGVHEEYMRHLLHPPQVPEKEAGDAKAIEQEAAAKADELVGGSSSDSTARRALESAKQDPALQRAIREKVALNLTGDTVEKEHALEDFAFLLRPNPRAMKRFVNAYGMARALDWIAGGNVERGPMALWTILNLQWPLLGDYLGDHPEMAHYFQAPPPPSAPPGGKEKEDPLAEIPEQLRPLFRSREVRRVICPPEIGVSLTEERIRACAGLRPEPRSGAIIV